ncbi:MAG: serine hydrolase domain-containing protein [Pseudomonadota bacterium]
MTSLHVAGNSNPNFRLVEEAFLKNFEQGQELGAAVCVYHKGDKVVDLWAGSRDADQSQPWSEDTIVNVWSTTKGAAAACVAKLVEAGQLDYSAPVSTYWPEFGVAGKQDITIAQLFSHQSGVCGLSEPVSHDQMYDIETVTAMLASETPMWEPGTRSGYHAISIGYFAEGLFQRVVGESVGEFFNRRIAEPLDLEFYMGLPEEHEHRVAELIHEGNKPDNLNQYEISAQVNFPVDYAMPNERRWREMGLPSAGGTANARGVAGLYRSLLSDLAGQSCNIASADVLKKALACEIENQDLVLEMDLSWAAGFALSGNIGLFGPNMRSFGHFGWGGSFGFGDPETGLSVGYSMNCMREIHDGDQRAANIISSIYQSITD